MVEEDIKEEQIDEEEPEEDVGEDIDEAAADEPVEDDLMADLNADLVLADVQYYEERDYEAALELYQKVAEEEVDESLVTRALYWTAECLVKLSRVDEASAAFEDLASRFAEHHLGASAQRRLATIQVQ